MKVTSELHNIYFVQGDITYEETDVIVNAANKSLRGGGGVDRAIHRAGGPDILKECIEKYPSGCETGEARITSGGLLKAKWVIHTPGPIWRGGNHNEEKLLENSYKNSFRLAESVKANSISFPSISTGIYGFPIEKAALTAIGTIISCLPSKTVQKVRFVLFSQQDYDRYLKVYHQNF
ncbi:MAG: O-acetyl-ADP-ribose deacetylase [Candidatus Hodarchaeales archaeon]